MHTRTILGAIAACTLALLIPIAAIAAMPTAATMFVGNERSGSDGTCGPLNDLNTPANECPPHRFVGESAEAVDIFRPRTVTLAVGGAVTFDVSGAPHRVGVCEAGVGPDDVSLLSVNNVITDARCNHPASAGSGQDVTYQFNTAGKYLVICKFLPHFMDREQYGWVIVR